MKQMHVSGVVAAVVLFAVSALAQGDADSTDGNDFLNAVVKLEVTTAKPDICCPWVNRTGTGTGSGVVIDSGRILTCAHCVTDACYIRVRKHNEDTLYHGSVQFVDNDADLALVCVEEPSFMDGIAPMEIGETPLCVHHGFLRLSRSGETEFSRRLQQGQGISRLRVRRDLFLLRRCRD